MTAAVGVPCALALLALVDAAFAGFRASTGRNARIRKWPHHVTAGRRGLLCGAAGIAAVALLIVITVDASANPAHRFAALVDAGTRMLQVLAPYATVMALSLVAYWTLPMRQSTFVILVGLGPLTLLRPVVVAGAAAWTVAGAEWLVWVGSLMAATSVLAVEPVVHRRWYRDPL